MPERYSPREAGVEIGSFLHDYYKQMIEKKEIPESALKSTIDPDYKPKGKKLLSNYRTTKITEEFIKANKKDYPFLKHIRTSPDTESCMWLDGKNPVAVVVVRKENEIYTWITSIDIFPRYRGYGLSYQVLDYATKKMGANCLTVAKDNEIAKKVYDKYGFREMLIEPKQNAKVTYMALPGTLKESAYMNPQSVVYFTRDISPESLVKIYKALGVDLPGKVMVKISSGEPGGHHFLSPDLIAPLVKKVNGTICDANTAYEGKRHRTRDHRQVMHDHGFDAIAPTDILDATGDKAVPVRNGYHLEEVRIGNQTDLYDSVLVLSHFKGHAMAGFGGALKNVAIGMASAAGKALVHTAGKSNKTIEGPQQDFLRSMVDSISGITNYIGKDKFVYINIANNLSVDCDCDAHPAPPTMEDIGIFASTDPVAVDQACIDAVYFAEDSKDLITRIKRQTGLNILKYAAEHGIGSRRYQIVDMDRPQNLFNESAKPEKERIKLNGDEIEVHRKVTENPNDPVDKTAHDLTFYLDGKMLAQISISAVNSKKAFLYNFEVVESHRGKGYGTAILKWVMKNYKVNELTVDKDNARAIDLYKKFGFKIGKEFKEDGKTRIDMKINMNESFSPCERLKDAIDNIFSHNALVQLWTPVIHDTNGERYNYKLWDGEAWKIPEEYLDLDILSINDIADDEHLGYINIIIDSDYVPMEESAKNEKLYPVYITLFSNDTNFGKLIRKATGSEYSHATVALDPTMNNMYSFSDIPYNEARFFCAGFVRESIWSPEYTKNRHFRVLVTFVNKAGRDKIQKKIDYSINNFEKYNYNDIGLVQYYFKFKNTKKHDETKKMRWFCSEFVSAIVNSSDETEGFENILASPQDLLGKPNVIDLGKFTIPEFNEEELVRKTRTAEKEFRKHANLSKSVVNESVDEWLYELIDESALNEIFNKAKSKKPKFDERQVQKYTFNLDWKLLYEKFKELFPKNDPSMRFDLFGVIVRYFLIPTKAAAVNVTQQIIDQMVKIASFVKNGFIKLIDAVSSLIFFQGEDGDDVMRYPDGPMHEATNTINEIVNSKVDFKDIHKIVDNLSPKEKKWLYNGSTFKDSPYVVYRDIQYKNVLDKKHGGFLEAYIFPKEKNNIYVSIAVDKESRRLGIADLLMNRFMLVIQAFCPNKTVIWKVKPDNTASIELAKKMGFADISDLKNPDQYKYEMVLNEAAKSSLKVNTSLYFISKDRLDESEIIHPRIPDDYMTQHGYEDNKTPRVCFSTSIDGCLTALGMNVSNQKFYVYHPISDAKVITPTEEQVPDASITKERWICEPVQLHYIGAIKAIDTNGPHDDGTPYRYGKNKEFEARLYHWGWKWLNRPAVSRNISESASIPATLYHGSPKTFKVARVHDSGTSGAHLFATSMRSFALAYAGAEWSDFEINQSRVNGDMCLTEILPGKFREVFSRPGYLHILPADTFKSFHGVEFISDEDVRVQKTYKISNVLKELQKAPDVKLYYYPDLPPFIQDRERYLRDMAIKYNHNIDKILAMTKELRVEVKESTNPNDGQSSKAVKLTFYLGNDKVGEAGVSGYDTGVGFLYDLEVVERFRGKGYSKQILDYVMKNYSVTDLSVAADNKVAINLYEKFGFKLKKTFNSNGENGYEKGRFRWYQLDESAGVINEMAYEDYCDCFYAKLKSLAAQYNKRDDIFKHVAKVLKMEQKDLPKFDCHIQVSGEKQLCFSLVNPDTPFEIRCEYEKYLKEMIEDLEKDADIKTKCPRIKSIWTADAEGTIYVNLDYEHINEAIADTHSLDREQKKRIADKYGLRQGGYGQRTSKEDEDRMKKSAEWEKKIPLKQRKKIYREDGHPEELIPSHEEVRDPVDDCLPIAEAASDSEIEKLLELNRKLNKYDYIDNSTGKNYKLRSPGQFESDHGGVCWDFVVYQADQFKKLGITNYKTYYVVFDKAPNYPTHTFQIIKLNNQYVYFESSYIRIRGIWMAKSSNDLISFVINTMIKQTKSLKDARYEVREYNPSEGKLIGMNAVEFMNYMNEKKFASFRYIKEPKITKINKPEDLNEAAAVADDTKGDGNNFHKGNKLIHWYDGWTADGCQFDLEGVAEGEEGAYRFEVDIDSKDNSFGTIYNLTNPDKSLITEATERVLIDPNNKEMVQRYRDLGYEFIPSIKNRGKAQPMFKINRSKPNKLYPVYVVLFYSGTALGKLIKAAAGPHFSHAAISFTEDLTEMYSFGRKSGLNVEAFVVDSIENEAYRRPDTQYAIYMVPATANQYDRMKDRINWFIKNAAKFKYNFSGLFKNYLGISDNPKYRYFCSQFVADILNVADPAKPYFADPSLVTPENFIYTTFAQYIVSGPLSEFDPEHVRKISNVLLAREIKNRNATFKNESASIPYSKPLTIRFTNDKIPIVTKSHYNRINSVYNDAEKIIQNDESDDRLVTDMMCKLAYTIEIMDRYLTKSLGRKDELYKNMIQLRSKILKLITQGHKRMMSSSESYDFQEIYNKSKYAEVPKTSAIIGEELRTLL